MQARRRSQTALFRPFGRFQTCGRYRAPSLPKGGYRLARLFHSVFVINMPFRTASREGLRD